MSDIFSKLQAKGAKNRLIVAGGLLAALIGGVIYYSLDHKELPQSNVSVKPSLDATAGGENQKRSPVYQEAVERANDQRFNEGMEKGKTVIPTIENPVQSLKPLEPSQEKPWKNAVQEDAPPPPVSLSLPSPPPPPPAARPAEPAPQEAKVPEKNDMSQAIYEQMKQLAALWAPRPAGSFESKIAQGGGGGGTGAAGAAGATGGPAGHAAGAGERKKPKPIITAGSILYGSTLTATNSDATNSPVVATIDAGPFRKSRLVGGFQPAQNNGGKLVVKFTKMTLPTGDLVPIEAYAVDGTTAETAVASDVEGRYLQRYGPVLAAAFVAGFGQAAGTVGTMAQSSMGGTVYASPAPTLKQAAFTGLGTAAGMIAGDVMARAPKGPLIKLDADYPIAILFVDAVYPPGSQEGVEQSREAAALAALAQKQNALNGQTAGQAPVPPSYGPAAAVGGQFAPPGPAFSNGSLTVLPPVPAYGYGGYGGGYGGYGGGYGGYGGGRQIFIMPPSGN